MSEGALVAHLSVDRRLTVANSDVLSVVAERKLARIGVEL